MAKNFRISPGAGGPAPGMPVDTRGNHIYTPDQVDQIDREGNRRKISGAEMECMMGLVAGGNVIINCAPVLFEHARHCGKLPQLKRMVTQMRKLITYLNMHVSVRQMGSICTQLTNAHITVSSDYVPAYINVKLDDLLHICNRAMESCAWSCTCTRDQSKACELRRALELVPGVKESAKEIARKDASRCPYRGMEMEGDVDD